MQAAHTPSVLLTVESLLQRAQLMKTPWKQIIISNLQNSTGT